MSCARFLQNFQFLEVKNLILLQYSWTGDLTLEHFDQSSTAQGIKNSFQNRILKSLKHWKIVSRYERASATSGSNRSTLFQEQLQVLKPRYASSSWKWKHPGGNFVLGDKNSVATLDSKDEVVRFLRLFVSTKISISCYAIYNFSLDKFYKFKLFLTRLLAILLNSSRLSRHIF